MRVPGFASRSRSRTSLALGFLVPVLAAALAGCATVSKGECQSGDWYGIGVRDGASGHGEERFVDNAKACAKHGISADRERWLDGRMRGLERYCTLRNGLQVGENNGSYRGVCTQHDEEGFLRGYETGRELHFARGRVSSLDSEIHDIRERLRRDREAKDEEEKKKYRLSDAERVELAYRLGVAVVKREEAERDLAEIEYRARELD
jgi:Protein of unknown function (DUF2799)